MEMECCLSPFCLAKNRETTRPIKHSLGNPFARGFAHGPSERRMRPDAMPSTSLSLLRTVGKVRTIGYSAGEGDQSRACRLEEGRGRGWQG